MGADTWGLALRYDLFWKGVLDFSLNGIGKMPRTYACDPERFPVRGQPRGQLDDTVCRDIEAAEAIEQCLQHASGACSEIRIGAGSRLGDHAEGRPQIGRISLFENG